MPLDQLPVPADRLADGEWTELERAEWRPFDVRFLAVEANRVVYEDAALRDRIHESTGVDGLRRFFLAARLELTPTPPRSRALTALVTGRALSGFVDTLAERGFTDVRRAESWENTRQGPETERRSATDRQYVSAEYIARCSVGDLSLRAGALARVRPAGEGYVLTGGAYPTAVRNAPDGETAEAIGRELDPARFRSELLTLIRATE